jgi:hypothetical protein
MEYNQIIDKSERELLFDLGREIAERSEDKRSIPPVEEYIDIANKWIDKHQVQLSGVICGSEMVKKAVDPSTPLSEKIEIYAAIADLIASFCIGFSPFTVSVLIVKYYVKHWCS